MLSSMIILWFNYIKVDITFTDNGYKKICFFGFVKREICFQNTKKKLKRN